MHNFLQKNSKIVEELTRSILTKAAVFEKESKKRKNNIKMERVNFQAIEKKWQDFFSKEKL